MAWGHGNLGGGAAGFPIGMILVTYPKNSILTISAANGGKYSKNDISDTQRIYYVKDQDDYTITSSFSGKTASRTVNITSLVQSVSIILNYELVLYNNGVTETVISGGLNKYDSNSAPVNFTDDYITMGGTTASAKCSVATVNKIDVSSYSQLIVKYYNSSNYPFAFGLITSRSTDPTYETDGKYSSSSARTDIYEATLDISSFTGEYYIGFSKSSAGTRRVYEIKLV